jgi:hypothetical protein
MTISCPFGNSFLTPTLPPTATQPAKVNERCEQTSGFPSKCPHITKPQNGSDLEVGKARFTRKNRQKAFPGANRDAAILIAFGSINNQKLSRQIGPFGKSSSSPMTSSIVAQSKFQPPIPGSTFPDCCNKRFRRHSAVAAIG